MSPRLEIPVHSVASFSGDGRVYRVFTQLLAVRDGELFMVPMALATGDLRGVVDGCPVPWLEVIAVLDADPEVPERLDESVVSSRYPWLATIDAHGWSRDRVGLTPNGPRRIERLVHLSGIRFARTTK